MTKVEKKKVDTKKVDKTTPTTIKKSTTDTNKSTITTNKQSNKSKEITNNNVLNKEKEPSLQVINLDDLINNNSSKKEEKSINTNLKGDKLVQEILSFFNIENNNFKLNDSTLIEKLESDIKENSNKVIEIVSSNYQMIMELVNQLLESNEISALVVLLMVSRSVSSFNQPKLIESLLIKKDNYSLVSIVSKCFSDISSDNIKDLIQYILGNKQFKSTKEQLEQLQSLSSQSTSDIQSSKELDSILTIPISHDSMVVSIRSLSISSVLVLLRYLYSRISLFTLSNDDTQQQQQDNNTNSNNSFTLKQIVDWISLIFDSHFQELSKVENINQFFGPIRSLHNNSKSFFFTKSFIDFLEKSSSTKSIENNNYSIYHYKF